MGLLQRFKPSSASRTRLLLAACMWTAVGAGLFVAGAHWLISAGATWAATGALAALVIGTVKGHLVLRRRARANAERIVAAGEARCVGGVFNWTMWLLALFMMGLGIALRRSSLPRPWLGVIYLTIGVAMLSGSAAAWTCWIEHRPPVGPETDVLP